MTNNLRQTENRTLSSGGNKTKYRCGYKNCGQATTLDSKERRIVCKYCGHMAFKEDLGGKVSNEGQSEANLKG